MTHLPLLVSGALVAAALVSPSLARAQSFAEPPHQVASRHTVAIDSDSRSFIEDRGYYDAPEPSVIRFLVGPAIKADANAVLPGLFAAVDIGRGATGVRFAGGWMDVGHEKGVHQYTGELTVDFGGRSRFRPVIGAGGGVARTSSSTAADGTVDTKNGATIGVGVVRAGLGVRLPFPDADARVALDVTGVLPAIKGESAPEIGPWVNASLMVGIGF